MKASEKRIITLTNNAIASVNDARSSRWELGQALLAEFFCMVAGEIVTNKSEDKEAMTVSVFAGLNHKACGKSKKALEVFYGEAIRFAKKHKTVESAMKEPIKGKKVVGATRFSATASAESSISRLGQTNAVKMARKIIELAGK